MESVEYNASLTMTGSLRETTREKPFQELGLELPKDICDGIGNFVTFWKSLKTKLQAVFVA